MRAFSRQQKKLGLVLARLTPVAFLSVFTLLGLMISATTVGVAVRQPWMGLSLNADPDTDTVNLTTVARPDLALPVPARLVAVTGSDNTTVALEARDLLDEPDVLPTYDALKSFFARQDLLHNILAQEVVTLTLQTNDGAELRHAITPAPTRPLADLPPPFWIQIFVGLAAYLVSIWVWSLRRTDLSTRLFALTGATIAVFSHAAAIYSTRELAIDGALFNLLSVFNHFGATGFGCAMIVLLLSYPRRIAPKPVLIALPLIVGVIWLMDSLRIVFDGPPMGSHLPTLIEMLGILVAGGLQYAKTGDDPRARAVLRWFGLSVSVGSGLFVFTIVAPNLVGASPLFQQGYAFLSFLLIHMGLALGISRHRIFELDKWAFRIVFYLVGAVLLLALDAVLILVVAVDRAPAFGLSLLIVAFLYLPFRDTLARRLGRARGLDRGKWFQQVVDVALAHDPEVQNTRWRTLLQDVLAPLRMVSDDQVATVTLASEGLSLIVPAAGEVAPVRLEYAHGGRKLFTLADVNLVTELYAMLTHAMESRRAYEKGVSEERTRIARDMHDNIGVQLLGALHSPEPVRKNTLIRETLSDLRDIINNAAGPGTAADEALADLRAEIFDHLEAAGVDLTWNATADDNVALSPAALHALRSVMREMVGNVMKHAQATAMTIDIRCTPNTVSFTATDNGRGFDPTTAKMGNGLTNMRERLVAMDGDLALATSSAGTRFDGRLALTPRTAPL